MKTLQDLVDNEIIPTCDLEVITSYDLYDATTFVNVHENKLVKATSESKNSVTIYYQVNIHTRYLEQIDIHVCRDGYVDLFRKIIITLNRNTGQPLSIYYVEYRENGEIDNELVHIVADNSSSLVTYIDNVPYNFDLKKIGWEIATETSEKEETVRSIVLICLNNEDFIQLFKHPFKNIRELENPVIVRFFNEAKKKEQEIKNNKELRKFLFSLVMTTLCYTDDGELQLNQKDGKTVDFKRENINVLVNCVKTIIEDRRKENTDSIINTTEKVVNHFSDIYKNLYLRNGQYKFNEDTFWLLIGSIVEYVRGLDIQDTDVLTMLRNRKSLQWFIQTSIAHGSYFKDSELNLRQRFRVSRDIVSSILGVDANLPQYHNSSTDEDKQTIQEVKKKVYIAGPMSGLPNKNYEAFYKAEELLVSKGYIVFNPARLNDPHPGTRKQALRNDYRALIECDAVALLPSWENSTGVGRELSIASDLELEVKDLDKF